MIIVAEPLRIYFNLKNKAKKPSANVTMVIKYLDADTLTSADTIYIDKLITIFTVGSFTSNYCQR